MFPRITEYAHQLMESRIKPGDWVIDATMGNGHDTAFLARLVGEMGRVYAYDVQEQAIVNTQKRLIGEGLQDRVELHLKSHDQMNHPENQFSVVVFNLGYLPGTDKRVTTTAETTVSAIENALALIKVGGIVLVVVYWGHEQGKREKSLVESFIQDLPYPEFMVLKYQYINPQNNPPFVLAIERRK